MSKFNNTPRKGFLNYLVAFSCIGLLSFNSGQISDQEYDMGIKHGIVYYEEGKYAGWPANHGIWTWDNEILVGFIEASYADRPGFHTYDPRTSMVKYARSMDGGIKWTIENAYERGQTGTGADHRFMGDKAKAPSGLNQSLDFTNPNFILTFLRQNNNFGPSHIYYSNNRGHNWNGPYLLPDLGTPGFANRTDYFIDGEQQLGAFFTVAKSNKREGRVAYVRTEDGALNWEIVSWVGPEHGGFDIMPSSLRLSPTEIITTIRVRTEDRLDLMSAYISEDNGKTWERLRDPVADTGRGGSPPALVQLQDGRLAMGYIYRSEHGSRVNVRFSSDNGRSWSDEIMLRGGDGANRDTGYPRMTQRPDGKLVMIYYWNNALIEGGDPYRYIAYTIFDPDKW
jgi:hypothetical protein